MTLLKLFLGESCPKPGTSEPWGQKGHWSIAPIEFSRIGSKTFKMPWIQGDCREETWRAY